MDARKSKVTLRGKCALRCKYTRNIQGYRMSKETTEIVKCANQSQKNSLCRECKRAGVARDQIYEEFVITKNAMGTPSCDGYINKKQGSLL